LQLGNEKLGLLARVTGNAATATDDEEAARFVNDAIVHEVTSLEPSHQLHAICH
jgi:hypothetical protein